MRTYLDRSGSNARRRVKSLDDLQRYCARIFLEMRN
jgi:hypothetical protein